MSNVAVRHRASLYKKLSFFAFETATDMNIKTAHKRLIKILKKHKINSSSLGKKIWSYVKGYNLKPGNGFLLKEANKSWIKAKAGR